MKRRVIFFLAAMIIALAAAPGLCESMATIQLSDDGCTVPEQGVTVEGSTVTILQPGEYLVSGSLSDGQLAVDCAVDGKVVLWLNGVRIHYETGPAIFIGECKPRVVISLVDQSENELSNGSQLIFTDGDEPNGTIFSRSDLTISGNGALMVTSGAMDSIVSKDDLRIEGGVLNIHAARHGIRGKDAVEISGGDLTIEAGQDGIKSTNSKEAEWGYLRLTGGVIRILCGDDALDYETTCTISGAELQIELQK